MNLEFITEPTTLRALPNSRQFVRPTGAVEIYEDICESTAAFKSASSYWWRPNYVNIVRLNDGQRYIRNDSAADTKSASICHMLKVQSLIKNHNCFYAWGVCDVSHFIWGIYWRTHYSSWWGIRLPFNVNSYSNTAIKQLLKWWNGTDFALNLEIWSIRYRSHQSISLQQNVILNCPLN